MIESLRHIATTNTGMLHAMFKDIADADMTLQPPHLPNHPAWQVSHLTFVRAAVPALLGQPGPVPVADFESSGPGSIPSPDRANYPSKDTLLAKYNAADAHFHATLATLTPAQLDQSPPPPFNKRFPTFRAMILLLVGTHDALHLGQLTDWRRSQKLPPVI